MPKRPMFKCKRNKVILVFLVVLQIALGLIYLKTVPRIYTDEVWDSALGYSLANGDGLKHPFIEGFGGMDIHFVQPRVVLPFVCAAIFKIFGYSVLAGRMGSLLLSVLAVVSLYALMRKWFGEKQAFCIAIATMLHPWFFEVSRRIRPEIYYTALAIAALWCVVYSLDKNSKGIALLGGVLAGLAAMAHPGGLILDAAMAGAVLIWLRTKKIGRPAVWTCLGFAGVILPYIAFGLPFMVYLATSYIKSIPDSMIEAARMDGCGYLRVFLHVILPVSRPVVATMIIFSFLANWNEFILVLTLTSKTILRSLPVGINALSNSGMSRDFGKQFAALVIGTLPMIIFYIIFHKQLAKGFAAGSIKE